MGKFTLGIVSTLGDGYIPKLNRLIKFNVKPLKIKTETCNYSQINDVLVVSSTRLINFSFGYYLEESPLKLLDFLIINDDQKYYNFTLIAVNRMDKCDKFRRYPKNTNFHVNEVEYGLSLEVLVSQELFPNTKDEMKKLLKLALNDLNQLTEEQKKEKCKVLINTKTMTTMTLEEIFNFKVEFLNDNKHEEYQSIIGIGLKKHRESALPHVKNEDEFKSFLIHLYTCYRKIELKIDQKSIIHIKNEYNSTVESCLKNLQNAKNEFKPMNKNDDYMKMYPIMKNLFYKYTDYFEFFIHNRLNINEGEDLPGSTRDFKIYLKRLNKWEASCDTLIYPSTSLMIKNFIVSFEKYKNIKVVINDEIEEPRISLDNEDKKLFGIVKIRNPSKIIEDITTSMIMDISCPIKCSTDKRIWFCYNCGDIVKIHHVYTICSCGKDIFNKNELICNHPIHQEDVLIKQLPSTLRSIVNQLKKYEDEHIEIKQVVKTIIHQHYDTELMKNVIQQMNNSDIKFDGDTKYLFTQFLNF